MRTQIDTVYDLDDNDIIGSIVYADGTCGIHGKGFSLRMSIEMIRNLAQDILDDTEAYAMRQEDIRMEAQDVLDEMNVSRREE